MKSSWANVTQSVLSFIEFGAKENDGLPEPVQSLYYMYVKDSLRVWVNISYHKNSVFLSGVIVKGWGKTENSFEYLMSVQYCWLVTKDMHEHWHVAHPWATGPVSLTKNFLSCSHPQLSVVFSSSWVRIPTKPNETLFFLNSIICSARCIFSSF